MIDSRRQTLVLSEKLIRQHAADPGVSELKDSRHPLILRFHASRERASWFVVVHESGKAKWKKAGTWPHDKLAEVVDNLSSTRAKIRVGESVADEWETVGELLDWYRVRCQNDRNLSKQRKAGIRSAINKHLIPMIGEAQLAELSASLLDRDLMWPLQAEYALSTVRMILALLKVATKQAYRLKKISRDYCAGVTFRDFSQATIAPKDSRLRADHVPGLIGRLPDAFPMTRMLVLMMLCHGTRLGETRKARWVNINLADRVWHIPAEDTKTKTQHELPLTDIVVNLLVQYRECSPGAFLFPASVARSWLDASSASEWIRDHSQGEWTSHDLRKLARTVWADLGVEYMVGEMLLNHALSKMDKTYIHTLVKAQSRESLQRYHVWLNEQGLGLLQTETEQR